MRPLQPAGNLHFPQLSLASRLFVGRGLDPSLLFCGYRPFSRRGEVTPPYIVISSQLPLPASLSYKCARAARTPYLLSIISYLLFRLPLRGNLVPDGAPVRSVPGNCNKKTPRNFLRGVCFGAPSGTRTQDPLIKSQLLSQMTQTKPILKSVQTSFIALSSLFHVKLDLLLFEFAFFKQPDTTPKSNTIH